MPKLQLHLSRIIKCTLKSSTLTAEVTLNEVEGEKGTETKEGEKKKRKKSETEVRRTEKH